MKRWLAIGALAALVACSAPQSRAEAALATIVAECRGAQLLAAGEAGATAEIDRECERALLRLDRDAGTAP